MSNLKKVVFPALSLFVICLVSVLLLAVTNMLTKDDIAKQNAAVEQAARAEVFPEAASFRDAEGFAECLDKDGNVIGYIFVTSGKGYGGAISVMTGIAGDGVITGVTVLEHAETSSYGGKAIKNNFTDEYTGKKAETFVKGKNIDGWTGATRTTNGVIAAVNAAVDMFSALKGE